MNGKYRDKKSKKLEKQQRENERKQRKTRSQKRSLVCANEQSEDDDFLPGLKKWDNEITLVKKTNADQSLSPNFNFTAREENDSQDSVLLQLEKNCAMLNAIDLNIEPKFSKVEADSDTESKKSVSLLHDFELINYPECRGNNCQVVEIDDSKKYEEHISGCDSVSGRMHKTVQTGYSIFKQLTCWRVNEDAAFLEALIFLKNLSNTNLEERRFYDVLADYSFRFGSDVSENLESSNKVMASESGFDKPGDSIFEKNNETLNLYAESKVKRKKTLKERKPCQRSGLRSEKEQILMTDGIRTKIEDEFGCENSFDFTPGYSEDFNLFGGYQNDSSQSEDSFENSPNSQKICGVFQSVNDVVFLKKALQIFLEFTTNVVIKNMAELGRTWKNSSVDSGMKIINRIVGCSIGQLDVREIFFHFLKKIFDSFFDKARRNVNRDLEYRASFLIVICDSPYFYLDLINYSIGKLNRMKQCHEFLTLEDSIQLVGGNCFTCRVLKRLLEKFYSDLKNNLDTSSDFIQTESVTVLNLWEKRWRFSRFEDIKSSGRFQDFKTMVHGWYESLSDFLSFCWDHYCVMTLIILECKSLVRSISNVIS